MKRRTMLAGGLASVVAAGAVVLGLTFANDSAAAEAGTGTTRVSVGNAAAQSTQDSSEPAISADGRYVAFTTGEPFDPVDKLAASQSDSGGTASETGPDADVYVRDTQLGTTTLISQAPGSKPGNGDSDQPSISGDGRFVAFRTTSTNILAPGSASPGIVVCDRDPDGDGTLDPTCRFTTITTGESDPANPHLSADGRRLSFDLPPQPVIEGPVNVGSIEIVNLRLGTDGTLGVPPVDDRTFASAPDTLTVGGVTQDLSSQGDSTMAAGGEHVAFVARYGRTTSAVFEYNVVTGKIVRLDLDADGNPIAAPGRLFSHPALSGDGRRYAFADQQGAGNVSVRLYDRDPDGDGTFGKADVEIASRTAAGADGLGAQPAFSADGRYLAFTTPTPGMHNGTDKAGLASSCLGRGTGLSYCDIVVRDVVLDHQRAAAGLPRLPAELASPSVSCAGAPQPCEGTGDSGLPPDSSGEGPRLAGAAVLSADGSVLAYGSAAPDLIDGNTDTNGVADVFRRRLSPGLTGDPQDFGTVPLGSEVIRDVPLSHVGFGPLTVTAVAVDGADFDVFPSEACTTVVLHETDQCHVSVRFKPTVLGPRTASLRITVNDSDNPVVVALTGTGVTPPAGVFAAGPDHLDFGARPVLRTSPIQSVTVRNTGDGPLTIGAVALSPAGATTFPGDYQLTAGACGNRVLPVGGNCRIDVRHRPTAVGSRPAVLTISYTGPTGPLTFPVTLTGAGTAPTLTSSPTVTPAGRVIQVTGTDFPPGSVSKLSLVGMPGATTAKAGAGGTFTVPFVVLPNTWTGHHPLNADVQAATAPGLTAPLRATLEFVIVPGSPVPPKFTLRQ